MAGETIVHAERRGAEKDDKAVGRVNEFAFVFIEKDAYVLAFVADGGVVLSGDEVAAFVEHVVVAEDILVHAVDYLAVADEVDGVVHDAVAGFQIGRADEGGGTGALQRNALDGEAAGIDEFLTFQEVLGQDSGYSQGGKEG